MKKLLAIQSTVFPNGDRINWEFGMMPQHKTLFLDPHLYNRWINYVHGQNNFREYRGWSLNKPKAGGVCFEQAQSEVLEMYKELLR